MKARAVAAAAVLALAACASLQRQAVRSVDAARALKLSKSSRTVIVDVRNPDEYAAGHLPGARLLPVGEIAKRLSELPADKKTPLLLYCLAGKRSTQAVGVLKEEGYLRIYNLLGGITAWKQAGYPVVQGPPPAP